MGLNLLEGIIDRKKMAVLALFLKEEETLFTLTLASKKAKVPVATVMRLVNEFSKQGIIETVAVGKIRLYRLSHNKKTQELSKLFKNE